MLAIIESANAQKISANVELVIGQNLKSEAIGKAQQCRIKTEILTPTEADFSTQLLTILHSHSIDIICLAGYMRLLPNEVVSSYQGRILNIHPALLPKFGGKGMYGIHVHEAVIKNKEKISGCTVHLVNDRYDEGEIINQLTCPVEPDDTAESLAHRVLELEHKAYPEAIETLWNRLKSQ